MAISVLSTRLAHLHASSNRVKVGVLASFGLRGVPLLKLTGSLVFRINVNLTVFVSTVETLAIVV